MRRVNTDLFTLFYTFVAALVWLWTLRPGASLIASAPVVIPFIPAVTSTG